MYLLIIILKKFEFMAAQRARPILLNERFPVISVIIKNVERASTARARESRDFHVRGTESGPNDAPWIDVAS